MNDSRPSTGQHDAGRLDRLLRRWFTADARSLAAMRIGTAAVLLFDTWDRSRNAVAHYSDAGVLPREVLLSEGSWTAALSLNALGGSAGFQFVLFALTGLVGVTLLFGFRTRLSTIVAFVLVVSVQGRNPDVIFGGDYVLKMLLFWGIFLPWGAVLSLDRWRAARRGFPPAAVQVYSGGVAAAMLQVFIIYIFTAWLKESSVWRRDFTAIYWALSIDAFAGALGPWLYRNPLAMKALTASSLLIEAMGPLLLFFPVWTKRARMIGVLLIAGLHVGILLTMRVSFFPIVNIVSLLVFVPSEVWNALGWRAGVEPAIPPRPRETGLRAELAHLVPLVLVGYVLAWNVGLQGILSVPGQVLKIHQRWNMFAPRPFRDDGWWVLAATRADGRRIDLLRGGAPLSWDKPDDVLGLYGGERWRKLYRRLWQKRGKQRLRGFAPYLCRSWNDEHSGVDAVVEVEPTYVLERNLEDYRTQPPRPFSLGGTACVPQLGESAPNR